MRKFILLFLSLLLVSPLMSFNRYRKNNIVAFKKDAPFDLLKGHVYAGTIVDGEIKYKKIKNIQPDLFDYVFYNHSDSYAKELILYPLSSGKYEGKEIPYDAIKIIDKNPNGPTKFWTKSNICYPSDCGFPEYFFNRYEGDQYGNAPYEKKKGYRLNFFSIKVGSRYDKGVYYYYFFDRDSYKREITTMLKTQDNAEDMKLYNQPKGYEMLFDKDNNMFGLVDVTDGQKYWGSEALDYLEKNYLSGEVAAKEAEEAAEKKRQELEKAYPFGWAYFGEKGKGNIKFTLAYEIGGETVTLLFSGFNAEDNVIDEVFITPPFNGEYEKDPSIEPPFKVRYVESYFQQGLNFYDISILSEGEKVINLSTEKSVILNIDHNLNKSDKWKNKSGVVYYHQDRWGKLHRM
ncbi:MAG: hypothetical protein Q4B58_04925 [Bacteroidales bacterium]|nr:hypothetical protein [Bacteroidales bacterium]